MPRWKKINLDKTNTDLHQAWVDFLGDSLAFQAARNKDIQEAQNILELPSQAENILNNIYHNFTYKDTTQQGFGEILLETITQAIENNNNAEQNNRTKFIQEEIWSIIIDINLAREMLNIVLSKHRWNNKLREKGNNDLWIPEEIRSQLIKQLLKLNTIKQKDHTIMKALVSLDQVKEVRNNINLIAKLSILIILFGESNPEYFTDLDKILEQQLLIDPMINNKRPKTVLKQFLQVAAWAIETKTTGTLFQYRE